MISPNRVATSPYAPPKAFPVAAALFLSLFLLLLPAPHAQAGITGHWTPAVEFFNRGTLPPPGFYMKNYFIHYRADALRDKNGNKVPSSFQLRNTTMVNRFLWITDTKFLGADVGLHAIVPLVYKDVTLPRGQSGATFGLGDMMVEPLLSWRLPRVDFAFGPSWHFPTGYWSNRPENTITQDCFTSKLTFGTTLYLDAAKTWLVGGLVRYEIHSRNLHKDISRGDDLTLEWAASKRLFDNRLELGAGGYAQYQTTRDRGRDVTWDKSVKDRIYGIGPELKINIPEMNAAASFNYIHEFGAIDRAQGNIYGVSLTWRF